MRRFYVPGSSGDAWLEMQAIAFPDAVQKHLAVLRLMPGAEIEVFNGTGTVATVALVSASEGRIQSVRSEEPREGRPETILVLGLPKPAKVDDIVRAVTELGVDALWIVKSMHSQKAGDLDHKLSRWKKIAEEACRQSERLRLLDIQVFENLKQSLLEFDESDLLFWADARGAQGFSRESLKADLSHRRMAWWVGPEGGFSKEEEALLRSAKANSVCFPFGILRVETAAVCASAIFLEALNP